MQLIILILNPLPPPKKNLIQYVTNLRGREPPPPSSPTPHTNTIHQYTVSIIFVPILKVTVINGC